MSGGTTALRQLRPAIEPHVLRDHLWRGNHLQRPPKSVLTEYVARPTPLLEKTHAKQARQVRYPLLLTFSPAVGITSDATALLRVTVIGQTHTAPAQIEHNTHILRADRCHNSSDQGRNRKTSGVGRRSTFLPLDRTETEYLLLDSATTLCWRLDVCLTPLLLCSGPLFVYIACATAETIIKVISHKANWDWPF